MRKPKGIRSGPKPLDLTLMGKTLPGISLAGIDIYQHLQPSIWTTAAAKESKTHSSTTPADKGLSELSRLDMATDTKLDETSIWAIILKPLSPEEIRKVSLFEVELPDSSRMDLTRTLDDPALGAKPRTNCATCSQDLYSCPGHYARIEFGEGIYIWNPLFIKQAAKVLQCICKTCSHLLIDPNLLTDRKYLDKIPAGADRVDVIRNLSLKAKCHNSPISGKECEQNPTYKAMDEKDVPIIKTVIKTTDKGEQSSILDPIQALEILSNIPAEHLRILGFSYQAHPKNFLITNILVRPPCNRTFISDDMGIKTDSRQYVKIAIEAAKIKPLLQNPSLKVDQALQNSLKELVYKLASLYTELIVEKPTPNVPNVRSVTRSFEADVAGNKGKNSLLRKAGVAHRVNNSARTVIGADPYLNFDEIAIPGEIASKILIPVTVTEVNITELQKQVNEGKITQIRSPSDRIYFINKRKEFTLKIGYQIYRKLRNGDTCIANRQPTLNAQGIMAFKVRIFHDRRNIGLNPAVVSSYNADFDGDEMTLHFVADFHALAEARELMSVVNCLLGESTNAPVNGAILDSVTGGFLLSQEENLSDEAFTSLVFKPYDVFRNQAHLDIPISRNIFERMITQTSRTMYYHPTTDIGAKLSLINSSRKIYSTDLIGTYRENIDGKTTIFDSDNVVELKLFLAPVIDSTDKTKEDINQIKHNFYAARDKFVAELVPIKVYLATHYWYVVGSEVEKKLLAKRPAIEGIKEAGVVTLKEIEAFKAYHSSFKSDKGNILTVLLDNETQTFSRDQLRKVQVALPESEVRLGFSPATEFGRKLVKYGVPLFSGRAVISSILPSNFNYTNPNIWIQDGIIIKGYVDKKSIGISANSIVHNLYLRHSPQAAIKFIENFALLANEWLKFKAISPGLLDCKVDPELDKEIRKEINTAIQDSIEAGVEIPGETAEDKKIRERKIQAILNITEKIGAMILPRLPKDHPFRVMAESGAKGSSYNIGMIMGLIGQQYVNQRRIAPTLQGDRCFVECQPGDLDPRARGFATTSYYQGFSEVTAFKAHLKSAREALRATAEKTGDIGYARRKEMTVAEDTKVLFDMGVYGSNFREVMSVYGGDNLRPSSLLKIITTNAEMKRWKRSPANVLHFIDIARLVIDLNVKHGITDERLNRENKLRLINYFKDHATIALGPLTKGSETHLNIVYNNTEMVKDKPVITNEKVEANVTDYLGRIENYIGPKVYISDEAKYGEIVKVAIYIINSGFDKPVIRLIDTKIDLEKEAIEPDITRIAEAAKLRSFDPAELSETSETTKLYITQMVPLEDDFTLA